MLLQVPFGIKRVGVALSRALVQAAARHDVGQAQIARRPLEAVEYLKGLAYRPNIQRIDGHAFSWPGCLRSEEHTSELQSLMRISYAVFCLKKKKKTTTNRQKIKYIKSTNR